MRSTAAWRMTRISWMSLLLVMGVFVAACGGGGGSSSTGAGERDDVTLNVVSSFPRDNVMHEGFWMYVENLEEAAPWIKLDYRGGPDAIDPTQQGEAVSTGVVSMATLPDAYYAHNAPLAHALKLTPFTPSEERENGVYDFIQEYHQEALNVHYLGRTTANVPFQLFLNKEVTNLEDFKGLKIRVSPTYIALVKALGGGPVKTDIGQAYTALERGAVDGLGFLSVGLVDAGLSEVVDYAIFPTFYEGVQPILINLDTWNALDEETRQVMTDVMIETEPKIAAEYVRIGEEEREKFLEGGMEFIELEDAEAERFLQLATDEGWDEAIELEPKAAELREMFGQ